MSSAMLTEAGPSEALLRVLAPRGASAEISDVVLAFGGKEVLAGISFGIRPGEIVLLRGENGSGKTLLLNVLSGYLKPDSGAVTLTLGTKRVDARHESAEHLARQGVGRLWQDIRLFPTMSVLDNVLAATQGLHGRNLVAAIGARWAVMRQDRLARDRAMHNLALLEMADRAMSSCDKLSVGQMKRVALARLLQMEACLWLLDEPLAGLDATAGSRLVEDLERLRADQGKTILVVEHRHAALRGIADRTLSLRHGRVHEGAGADG